MAVIHISHFLRSHSAAWWIPSLLVSLVLCCSVSQAQQVRPSAEFPSFEELMGTPLAVPSNPPGRSVRSEEPDSSAPGPVSSSRSVPFRPSGSEPSEGAWWERSDNGSVTELPPLRNRSLNSDVIRPAGQSRILDRNSEFDPARDPSGRARESDRAGRFPSGPIRTPEANFDSTVKSTVANSSFDWAQFSTSIADLRFPDSTIFAHGDAFLTAEEEQAYLQMLQVIENKKRRALQQTLATPGAVAADDEENHQAAWEESFYRFEEARRRAWEHGNLKPAAVQPELNSLPDPFRGAEPAKLSDADEKTEYDLRKDIVGFPADFVGRPVLFEGRFTPNSTFRLTPQTRSSSRDMMGAIAMPIL
ncbi:MAG: hypothetical protein R3C49_16390 [Planctomycetaceae bacterium]